MSSNISLLFSLTYVTLVRRPSYYLAMSHIVRADYWILQGIVVVLVDYNAAAAAAA